MLTLPPDPLNVGNLLPSSTKEYYRMRVNRTKRAVPFSDAFQLNGRALLGPQASSPAFVATGYPLLNGKQARTPAVPEERAH